jgi:hypothetical protein
MKELPQTCSHNAGAYIALRNGGAKAVSHDSRGCHESDSMRSVA